MMNLYYKNKLDYTLYAFPLSSASIFQEYDHPDGYSVYTKPYDSVALCSALDLFGLPPMKMEYSGKTSDSTFELIRANALQTIFFVIMLYTMYTAQFAKYDWVEIDKLIAKEKEDESDDYDYFLLSKFSDRSLNLAMLLDIEFVQYMIFWEKRMNGDKEATKSESFDRVLVLLQTDMRAKLQEIKSIFIETKLLVAQVNSDFEKSVDDLLLANGRSRESILVLTERAKAAKAEEMRAHAQAHADQA
jgi:hypothetical protein